MTERFGFFLLPGFSTISLSVVMEPLRMANRSTQATLFEWFILSQDDQPVITSSGLSIAPTIPWQQAHELDVVIVVAGMDVHAIHDDNISRWLRNLARQQLTLGAVSTGTLLLARAKLLQDKVCTIHWENIDGLREEHPNLNVSGELYEFDNRLMTSSGGVSGLDMMLHYIALKHGEVLANELAEMCIHPKIRPAHEDHRMALQTKFNVTHPRLIKAIEIMQDHVEEPMALFDVAQQAGLSLRQLERLFRDKLSQRPAVFYLQLRLQRARLLLQQTALSVMNVATACGFNSATYFAKCYRKQYQRSPRDERSNDGALGTSQ
ncbi:MAG: GlxA family transcriptional regulator [Gammaproteobacteria bacterium]|nr:GlxA family transcriptional regulator [Gammaproteobacteria bacterium]